MRGPSGSDLREEEQRIEDFTSRDLDCTLHPSQVLFSLIDRYGRIPDEAVPILEAWEPDRVYGELIRTVGPEYFDKISRECKSVRVLPSRTAPPLSSRGPKPTGLVMGAIHPGTSELASRINEGYAAGDLEKTFAASLALASAMLLNEDKAQNAVMKAWEMREEYDSTKSSFATWVERKIRDIRADGYRYAKCRCGHAKREHKRKPGEIVAPCRVECCDCADFTKYEPVDIESVDIIKRGPKWVTVTLIYPCEDAEKAFRMKRDGYSTQEIAAQLGYTAGSMKVKLTQWRKKILVNH